MENLHRILINTSISLSVILAILGLINFKKSPIGLRLLTIMLLVSAFCELASSYYRMQGNNLFVLHIFTFLEFTIVGFAFQIIYKQFKKNIPLTAFVIIGAILIVLNSIFLQDTSTFNSYSYTFDSLFILAASLYYFTLTLEQPSKLIHEKVTLAIIVYLFVFHSVDLIFFCFVNEIMEVSRESLGHLQGFRSYVLLCMRIYLLYYLVIYTRSNKKSLE